MSKRPRKPKREDFNKAAFSIVPEATKEPEESTDKPKGWTAPTEEETPPPKIP